MRNCLFIVNPSAGNGKCGKLSVGLERILKGMGAQYRIVHTEAQGDAEKIARDLADDFDAVVSVGGDGTMNETLQGMVDYDIPLGVIPAGTGNDFAKMLTMPSSFEARVDFMLNGDAGQVDLGRIGSRYFLNVVGIGFDAAVNHEYYNVTALNGIPAYIYAIFKTLGKYFPKKIKVSYQSNGDANSIHKELFIVTVGNGSICGGGFQLTPHAKFNDGLFDINFVTPITTAALLWHFPKLFTGAIIDTPYCTIKKAEKLVIESDEPLPIHVDGEMYKTGQVRHEIEILPGAMKVIGA